jgi:TonB family protein
MEAARDPVFRDDLTGALNRRFLRALLEGEWERMLAAHERVALLLVDLDRFKEVNDRHGHLVGDEVLRTAVERLREGFRSDDLLVRYGGDEFVVVLPGADCRSAQELAMRARRLLAEEGWHDPTTGAPIDVPLSFSIGAAAAPEDGRTGEEVLAAADRRLYEDKRRRRGRRELLGRLPWLVAAGGAAILAVIGIVLWLRTASPEPPIVGAPPLRALSSAGELQALRGEVERLTALLATERDAPEDEGFEERIRELESALAAAEGRLRASAETPAVAPRAAESAVETSAAATSPAPSARAIAPLEVGTRVTVTPGSTLPLFGEEAPHAGSAASAVPVYQPPQLLAHDRPDFPLLARRRRTSGSVELRLQIDAQGRVTAAAAVATPPGVGFEEAARRVALGARYRPALRDGEPVASEATLQVRFVYDGR